VPRVSALVTAGVLGCAAAVLAGAPAVADSQVTVRGVGFPPGKQAQLSMVGCASLYDRSDEPLAPFIGRGPGRAPLGTRSLGYDLAGGNAVGSLHYVLSMVDTTVVELAVHAENGAEGVAYAGYQEPQDAGTADVWIGRAAVSAPAGAWARVQATDLTYTWTKYDMVTHEVVETSESAAEATVPELAATHGGDGAGFYTIGFGCDGARFSMDAWRIGSSGDVTSYDLEGLTTATAIAGSTTRVEAGREVTLTGRVRLGMGDRLQRGTLMLEARPVVGGEFEVIEVLDAAATDPSVVVRPSTSTVYRWRFADRPLAEGSVSSPFVVTVPAGADQPDLPEPPGPSQSPSQSPNQSPSQEPSETPATPDPPSQEPSATPATPDPPGETFTAPTESTHSSAPSATP
jgi:hypothetical protein